MSNTNESPNIIPMSNKVSVALYYEEGQVKQLLRRLPYLLSVVTSPKNSAKTSATGGAKVYEVHHSTFLLDLIADLTIVWNKMPPFFKQIMYQYFVLGETDLRIEAKTEIASKSIHRIRQLAEKAILAAMCKGDYQELEKLYEYKRYKQKPRARVITRSWHRKD